MTVRDLGSLFNPASVALIGASPRRGSVGARLTANLLGGGYGGHIFLVNPHHQTIRGHPVHPDPDALPETPDLAIVATPAKTVPGVIAALGRRGTRAAVVISAGFGERGDTEGAALQAAVKAEAARYGLRLVGPNCLGVMAPGVGLNASFSHLAGHPGDLAFVTQSGAMVTAVLDWAAPRGIGFSHMVSLGAMTDVDFDDMLDYLAGVPTCRAVLLYIEAIDDARRFMSAARACARLKPVIAVKAGRFAEGARAARSHTGALAGSDAVYDAAFRRAGMLRVGSIGELFDAAETVARSAGFAGEDMAILTNGGGFGVLATDALVAAGGRLARLAPETMARLDAFLPPDWSHGNPVDVLGDTRAQRYGTALEALLADANVSGVIALYCPTAVSSPTRIARAVIDRVTPDGDGRRRVFTSWVGQRTVAAARRLFAAAGVPTYDTPDQAVRAVMHMVDYRRNQAELMETPPSVPEAFVPDHAAAAAVIATALADGREWLTTPEAESVLAAYGIPVARSTTAATPEEAEAAAERLAQPVALKVLSPDIVHKTEFGAVALDLTTPEAVGYTARGMADRIRERDPAIRITGFTLQPMVRRADAIELIVGINEDAQFGPVVLFGRGGREVESEGDRVLALPPLNFGLARQTIARTRVARLLAGTRGRPGADVDAIASTLVKLAQLAADLAEVRELDINPLIADRTGVTALDARIRIAPAHGNALARLAILPYPRELEKDAETRDGTRVFLRPVKPEDEPLFHAAFARLDPEDVRLRFWAALKELSHAMAARLTQIDYDREMALVAFTPGPEADREVLGVVRIGCDPDRVEGEYAIIVRSDMKGHGLGYLLMGEIIAYARSRGLARITGQVLRENRAMLAMCDQLGFTRAVSTEEPGVVDVRLDLGET